MRKKIDWRVNADDRIDQPYLGVDEMIKLLRKFKGVRKDLDGWRKGLTKMERNHGAYVIPGHDAIDFIDRAIREASDNLSEDINDYR